MGNEITWFHNIDNEATAKQNNTNQYASFIRWSVYKPIKLNLVKPFSLSFKLFEITRLNAVIVILFPCYSQIGSLVISVQVSRGDVRFLFGLIKCGVVGKVGKSQWIIQISFSVIYQIIK